jgi:hypothetical protein
MMASKKQSSSGGGGVWEEGRGRGWCVKKKDTIRRQARNQLCDLHGQRIAAVFLELVAFGVVEALPVGYASTD